MDEAKVDEMCSSEIELQAPDDLVPCRLPAGHEGQHEAVITWVSEDVAP